ncbi:MULTISPECIES: ribonuclease P protein component [Kocuria]|uniref:Ribonuclease P protein component n=1 Tax=Kocuria subflava TaxID=1736139 RepID=A0A846TT98_9MICC|nr:MULTISPECIES: ribonuclease P protein component [unclassified Kocuria]NKE10200.1 ribonuclease P protein component [Kocuria subflava]
MLPSQHRMRTSTLFAATTRSGARQGRRNVVVYVHPTASQQPVRAGFVVSKAVGNAVTRNKVKRRLRSLVEQSLQTHPAGYDVVVRALPPSAHATFSQLSGDWNSAWAKAHTKAFAGGSHD